MRELARLFHHQDCIEKLSELILRAKYGVKSDALEIVALRGIGRVRASALFNSGFRSLEQLATADVTTLSKVPKIGKKIATEIKEQLGQSDNGDQTALETIAGQ